MEGLNLPDKQKKILAVHHIDYDKKNPDPEMKIVLCRSCNIRVNYNREYWKNYFQNLMKNKTKS